MPDCYKSQLETEKYQNLCAALEKNYSFTYIHVWATIFMDKV